MKTNTKRLLIILLASIALLICAFWSTVTTQYAFSQSEPYYADSVQSRDSYTISFSYAYYTESTGSIGSIPEYYNTNTSITNTCAPVAGAEIVGYYDRYSTNLIPNCTPGALVSGVYKYYPMTVISTYAQGTIDSLYTYMGTNSLEPGTSESQFQTGLTGYITNAGYSVSYTSIMNGTSIDFSTMTTQVSNGKTIALFMSDYNYTNLSIGSTSATYTITNYTGNHIFVASGYKQVTYYDSNNSVIRTDLFFYASTGYSSIKHTWYYVGATATTLNDALAISIS